MYNGSSRGLVRNLLLTCDVRSIVTMMFLFYHLLFTAGASRLIRHLHAKGIPIAVATGYGLFILFIINSSYYFVNYVP